MENESELVWIDGELMCVIEFDDEPEFTYDAPARSGALCQLYVPLRDRASMANVAVAVFAQLFSHLGDGVSIHNYLPGDWAEPDLKKHHGIDPAAPVGYFIGLPAEVPGSLFEHPVSIGGFVCETDRILDDWVAVCNRLDLVTVPSRWARQAFIESGVTTPIMVVPHGLEPEYRPYQDKVREDRFVFYNTFHSASFCARKGLNELVRSFLRAFDGRDDVVLRLRTDESTDLVQCRKRYDFGRLIEHDPINIALTTRNYARIFSRVHCTVHPSRGEGFGLVPFQSIACETPVIAPHATGMADYLDDSNSVALRTAGRVSGEGVGNAVGTYFRIDEDDLVEKLRYMESHWESEYDKVRAAAPAFRERFAWPNALADFCALIEQIVETNDPGITLARLGSRFRG
ncbi:MAG: glycosyltransferase family 1 protein [Proteobacteria bacterium]|nr:MAG: glycosyltransferase family 1 protein [Pseudomonadota bacterium]